MKRITLFSLTALVSLLLSCDKQDPNEFVQPRYIGHAGRLTFVESKASASSNDVLSIELTESGFYVLEQIPAGSTEVSYSANTYHADGQNYTLNGFGTLSFDNSASSSQVNISLTPVGGEQRSMLASFKKASQDNKLFRSWTIDRVRVTVRGWTTASADFEGCNFYQIADFLRKSGHNSPDDISPGFGIKSLSFTGTNSVVAIFTDSSVSLGAFSLSGDSFKYSWKNAPKEFQIVTDKAEISYMDGKCILSVNISIKNSTTSGSVTLVLSPME